MHGVVRFLACLALAFVPGVIGSLFPPGDWYAALDKPAVTPPGWVFPIAWTILYALIGTALFVFLRDTAPGSRRGPLLVFAAQLVGNALWSALFFGLEAPGVALVEIVLLWLSILGTIIAFARSSRTAALLLVPYLAWVGFATYLNASIWLQLR